MRYVAISASETCDSVPVDPLQAFSDVDVVEATASPPVPSSQSVDQPQALSDSDTINKVFSKLNSLLDAFRGSSTPLLGHSGYDSQSQIAGPSGYVRPNPPSQVPDVSHDDSPAIDPSLHSDNDLATPSDIRCKMQEIQGKIAETSEGIDFFKQRNRTPLLHWLGYSTVFMTTMPSCPSSMIGPSPPCVSLLFTPVNIRRTEVLHHARPFALPLNPRIVRDLVPKVGESPLTIGQIGESPLPMIGRIADGQLLANRQAINRDTLLTIGRIADDP